MYHGRTRRPTCRRLLTLSFVVVSTHVDAGIDGNCATEIPEGGHEIVSTRRAAGTYRPRGGMPLVPDTIKITWHVVTSTAGERSIEEATLDRYETGLKEAFAPAGITFCFDAPTHLIVDDALMADVSSHYQLRMIEPTPDAIDVYWCRSLAGGAICGVSSYSFGPIQGVVVQTQCEGHDDVLGILVHEVGHYFDLFHTHEIGFGYECPEGSDCETNGDQVCDTKPAPPLRFETCVNPEDCSLITTNPTCTEAIGPPLCPEGQRFDPDTDNYMSYTAIPCLLRFTAGQYERIRATYEFHRPELQGVDCPPLAPCPGDVNRDGRADGFDVSIVIASWGTADSIADLDQDGEVNARDLAAILANWGRCD